MDGRKENALYIEEIQGMTIINKKMYLDESIFLHWHGKILLK